MKRRMDRWSHVNNNEKSDHRRNDGVLDFNKIDAKRKSSDSNQSNRWDLNNNRMHRNNFANSWNRQKLQSSSNDSLDFDWINRQGRSRKHNRDSLDFNVINRNHSSNASVDSNRANERLNRSVGTSNSLNDSLFTDIDDLGQSSSSDDFLNQELHLNSSDSSNSSNSDEWQSALDDSVDWFNDITNSDTSSDAFDDYKRILSEYNSKYGVDNSSSSTNVNIATHAGSANSNELNSVVSSRQSSRAASQSDLFDSVLDFTGLNLSESSDAIGTNASNSNDDRQSSSSADSDDRGNRHYNYVNSYYDHHHPLIWIGISIIVLLVLIIGGISFKHYKDHQEQVETYESSRETAINRRKPAKHSSDSSTKNQTGQSINTVFGEFYAKLNKAVNSKVTPAKVSSEPSKSWKALFLDGTHGSGYQSVKAWLNNLKQNNVTVKSINYAVKSKTRTGKAIKATVHSRINYSMAKGSSRTEVLNNQLTLKKIHGRYYITEFNKGPMLSNSTVK